jgi:hypothetical protein
VLLRLRSHPAPLVPFLAFTGAADTTAPPAMSRAFFAAPGDDDGLLLSL